jgi:hypothetical protein
LTKKGVISAKAANAQLPYTAFNVYEIDKGVWVMQSEKQAVGWHVRNWGTWGWLETAVKSVGIAAGLAAFTVATSSEVGSLTGFTSIAAVGLLGLLTLLAAVALVLRVTQREIISLGYAVLNVLGHAGMLFYLVRGNEGSTLPLIFSLAYVAGELVKQRFLVVTGYTENDLQTSQMLNFSRGLMIAFLILAALVIL